MYYILQGATTWYVARSIPKVARLYNSIVPDQRYHVFTQHLYALKLKQRKRNLYKGLGLEISERVPKPPCGIAVIEAR